MLTPVEKYKLISFIFLFKSHRENSHLYKGEGIASFIKKTGIKCSYNTFSKYWNLCLKEGLVENTGKHQQIIGWDKCLIKLDVPLKGRRINKYVKNLKGCTLTKVLSLVEEAAILINLNNQESKLRRKQTYIKVVRSLANDKETNWKNNGLVKKIVKEARKAHKTVKSYCKSVLANHNETIVTGSRYLSQKLGISSTKVNNLLWKIHHKRIYKRKVVTKQHYKNNVNCATFDLLKGELSKNSIFFPSSKLDCFIQVLGSTMVPVCMYKF